MRRNRVLLLVAAGLAVGLVVVLLPRTPPPAKPVPRPAPAVEKPRQPPLQADAEGYYVPGYRFAVNRLRFSSFSLRPEPLVSFAQTSAGIEQPAPCLEALIRADTLPLSWAPFQSTGSSSRDLRLTASIEQSCPRW